MSRKLKLHGGVPSNPLAPIETGIPGVGDRMSALSKWAPLVCAGAAVGVSILALKEIKSVRRELVLIKKEQVSSSGNKDQDLMQKKIDSLEQEMKKITEFLKNRNELDSRILKSRDKFVSNAVSKPSSENVTIINGEEYEEVEVTDDEAESDAESDDVVVKEEVKVEKKV